MRFLIFLLFFFLVTLILVPFVGPNAGELQDWVFWNLRVPRVLCALVSGGALAVGGLVFQAVFRNSLATPSTLGTASGAALGASLLLFLAPEFVRDFGPGHWGNLGLAVSPLIFAAFLGALASLGFVFAVVRLARKTSETDILLAGVAVSFLYSSLIMLLQYVSDPTQTVRMLRWTMGGLDRGGNYPSIVLLLFWVIPALVILFFHHRELDLFCMGEEIARVRGVSIGKKRALLLVTASMMVAAVVSVCGPIGFLGLMVPHIARQVVGTRHRLLFPVSFLGGAVLLMVCDTFARTVIFPDELPVGLLTSLLGGPFFLTVLLARR